MKNVAVKAESISKFYKLYSSPRERLKEALNLSGKKYHKCFYALNNVSFEIKKGDTVGIIGKNGSGKSTLLQIIAGVLTPSDGHITINGRISALLELGAGFNPEFTGIENVYMQGQLMGFTKDEMHNKIDDILSFADIGDFVNHPVKTYSSGMFVRLAFSVATQIEPEILIVDEALSVGDMFFQAKSMRKMQQMIDNDGVTLLFVSHDLASVRALCNTGFLLENGQLTFSGKASKATDKYFAISVKEQQPRETDTQADKATNCPIATSGFVQGSHQDIFTIDSTFESKASFQRIQNGRAHFTRVILFDKKHTPLQYVDYDQPVILRMAMLATSNIEKLGFGYRIVNEKGVSIIGSNSELESQKNISNVSQGERYLLDWKFNVRLSPGTYTIAVTCYIPIDMRTYNVEFCDMIPISCQFTMNRRENCDLNALSYWNNQLEISKV